MIGELATSKAGHDKDRLYMIVGEEGECVYLCDGRLRGVEHPKKKKKKPTKSRVDVRTIVITAIVDFLVGLALLLIDKHT